MDLGGDSYGLPGYFTQSTRNNTRYNLYRKSTVGHNTLVFDTDVTRACMLQANACDDAAVGKCAQDPSLAGIGNISLFVGPDPDSVSAGTGSPGYAIVNMSAAYSAHGARRVLRGFAFTVGHDRLIIVDEIDFPSFTNVTWSMHTNSSITMDGNGRGAVLHQNNERLFLEVLEPQASSGLRLSHHSVELQPPQEPSPGVQKLVIVASASSIKAKHRIVVSLSQQRYRGAGLRINGLGDWDSAGPFASADDT